MDKLKIYGEPLPDMPWEERPADCKDVIWRYSQNPVIPRDILPTSNSVFNSAVVPFKGGLCRCVSLRRYQPPYALACRFQCGCHPLEYS